MLQDWIVARSKKVRCTWQEQKCGYNRNMCTNRSPPRPILSSNLVQNSERVRLQPRGRHFIFVRCAMRGYNRPPRMLCTSIKWAIPLCKLARETFQFTRSGQSPLFHPFQQGKWAMGFRCFVKCAIGTGSEASSPRSLASSKDDYDWEKLHEARLEDLLSEWRFYPKNFLKGQYLLRAVLRTWRQLCSVDAEIADAMYKQRLLRNALAAWRTLTNYQWDEEEDEGYDL